ncbi:MAG TPA: HEAT repeat domain-containing protein, partial [bacterium]|nr:HEAT repeat domain-containing protein [bacterium]
MTRLFTKIFDIKQGELKPVFLFFLGSFFIGLVTVFFETAASALFLIQWGAEYMPYTYLFGAVIIAFFGYVYSLFERRISVAKLFTGGFAFIFLTILGYRICFYFTDSRIIAALLFIWIDFLAVMGDMIFWGLINLSFDARQGKRLFGLIGNGDVLANILGGFSVPVILTYFNRSGEGGSLNLLYLASASMFVSMIIFLICLNMNKSKLSGGQSDDSDEHTIEESGLISLFKNSYVRAIFISSVFSIFVYYFVDFAFYQQIETKYPSENEIAAFVAGFAAAKSIIELLFRSFVSGKLLNKFGLTFGLGALPVLILITAVCMIASKFIPPFLIMFFWFVIASKLIDLIIRYAVQQPAVLILYQPMHQNLRTGVQTAVESIVEPIAGGVAGLILIIFGFIFKLQTLHIAYMLIISIAIWIFVIKKLKTMYPEMLQKALGKRAFGNITLSLNDSESKKLLLAGLESEHIGEIFYSLKTLDELGYNELNLNLLKLLKHADDRVRAETLKFIEKRNAVELLPNLYTFVETEKNSVVKSKALMIVCALGENEAVEFLLSYLNAKDKIVKKGAIAALLRSGGIEGVLAAGGILTDLIKSADPMERIFAAETLGIIGIKSFYRPLLELMNDSVLTVRKAAIDAAGELKSKKLWNQLIEFLSDNSLKISVSNALVKSDSYAGDLLIRTFNDNNTSSEVRKRIIQILSKMKNFDVKNFYLEILDYPDETIRHIIYKTLYNFKHQSDETERNHIINLIDKDIQSIAINISALEDINNDKDYSILINALKYNIFDKTEKILFLFSFIYQHELVSTAKINYNSETREKKIYALEIMDSILSNDLKSKFIPVIDDITNEQRLKKLNEYYETEKLSKIEKLKKIITGNKINFSFWTKACAVYIAGKLALKEFYQPIAEALDDENSIVRETAVWAFGRLNPNDLIERLQLLLKDKSSNVSEIARYVIETVGLSQLKVKKQYLTKTGECETGLFINILTDESESRNRRCRAAMQLANIDSIEARTALANMIEVQDETVLSEVLKALVISNSDLSSDSKA